MSIEEAVHAILGDQAASGIIADMGIHWAVVSAMAAATTADDPAALQAINDWNKQQRTSS